MSETIKDKKYFSVLCKCGHVGRDHYIPVDFPIEASSKEEAAQIARTFPRVKKNHKDAILNVKEILIDEYNSLREKNSADPYLKCKTRSEQKLINNFNLRLVRENLHVSKKMNKKEREKKVLYKLKKYKIQEKHDNKETKKYT